MSNDTAGSVVLHWGDNVWGVFVPFCQLKFRMDCRGIEPDTFRMKLAYNGLNLWHGLWQMFM